MQSRQPPISEWMERGPKRESGCYTYQQSINIPVMALGYCKDYNNGIFHNETGDADP